MRFSGIQIDELPVQCAFAGDNIVLTITGIDMTNIGIGRCQCQLLNKFAYLVRLVEHWCYLHLKIAAVLVWALVVAQ